MTPATWIVGLVVAATAMARIAAAPAFTEPLHRAHRSGSRRLPRARRTGRTRGR